MLPLTITNFLTYFCIAWGSNISLNFIYVVKRYWPETRKYDYPLDGRRLYKKDRLLGDSITFPGLILSLILAGALFRATGTLIWSLIPVLVYLGGAAGSFIKRRLHINSGEYLPLIDHGDYMIMTGLVFWLSGYTSFTFVV
jgi:CDP-2,3-bis-(O-geranylgeranyl)-sn-glycerol synthase